MTELVDVLGPTFDIPNIQAPDPAEFERLLREKYKPILTADEYQRLRAKCGLGQVIDGEVIEP
ncbi:hypothetical protein O7627_24325 [Solwaraspora sp. WMMD1047]|uniref:hypothetical protein n=1 Tax=Solwaraspora sp. WMMD1047 TaxID=3016102 RepID=UPI0024165C50|nr:hypothetical protein [Solwaraspora sp. WMMD1047]MDG4832410.1 hypothetical protein [Solwaraspora sp. WMMD1047]